MAKSKPADLSSLTIRKGEAKPARGAPQRGAAPEPTPKAKADSTLTPLNFRMPADFKKELRSFAFHNELTQVDVAMLGIRLVQRLGVDRARELLWGGMTVGKKIQEAADYDADDRERP